MGETVTSKCVRFLLNDSHWDPISCDTGWVRFLAPVVFRATGNDIAGIVTWYHIHCKTSSNSIPTWILFIVWRWLTIVCKKGRRWMWWRRKDSEGSALHKFRLPIREGSGQWPLIGNQSNWGNCANSSLYCTINKVLVFRWTNSAQFMWLFCGRISLICVNPKMPPKSDFLLLLQSLAM